MEKTHHTKPCYLTSSDSVYNLDTAYLILIRHPVSQRTFLPLFYKSNPGQPQKNYATAWKITKNVIYDLGLKSVMKEANPYGDYLNGNGQITFTNTIDRVITQVRCSIHEPDGSFARVDLDSAIIFKIDQQMPATLDLVSELLASKVRADKQAAKQIEAITPGQGV